jgi:hypothetical protein
MKGRTEHYWIFSVLPVPSFSEFPTSTVLHTVALEQVLIDVWWFLLNVNWVPYIPYTQDA